MGGLAVKLAAGLLVALLLAAMPAAAYHDNAPVFGGTAKSLPSYGFAHKEGFTEEDGALWCRATSDNGDYAGVNIPPSRAVEVWFRFKARTDGTSSIFEVDLSLEDISVSGNTKARARDDSLRVHFKEDGNNWNVHLIRQDGGLNILASTTISGPTDWKTFSLRADLQAGRLDLRDEAGSVLDAALTVPVDARVHTQWYRCSGSSGTVGAETDLRFFHTDHRSTQVVAYAADQPPVLGQHTQSPLIVTEQDSPAVEIEVTDDHGVDQATLYHSAGGNTFTGTTMTATSEPDTYRGQIPPYANGTKVTYYVQAEDTIGQKVTRNQTSYTVGSGKAPTTTNTAPNPGSGGDPDSPASRDYVPSFVVLIFGVVVALLFSHLGQKKRAGIALGIASGLAFLLFIGTRYEEQLRGVSSTTWVIVVLLLGAAVVIAPWKKPARGGSSE